jgi:uncharacterized membrane protein YkoI
LLTRTALASSLLAASLLAASGFAAHAQTAPSSPAPSAPAPTTAAPTAQAPAATGSRTYAAILGAKTSMARAVEVAERTGGNGRAIDVEFERRDGGEPAHYEIKVVYADGKLVEHRVDADTGAVLRSENQPFERYFTRLKAADFEAAKTSLRDAIALAERHVGPNARATEVDIDREGGAIVYEIDVETPTERREVRVDANGQVVRG